MNEGKYVFAQIASYIPRFQFDRIVEKYRGNYRAHELTCYNQFLHLLFGQIAPCNSLRDICLCLEAHKNILYHMGFGNTVDSTSLSRANERRDYRIYEEFGYYLIKLVRPYYRSSKLPDVEITNALFALFVHLLSCKFFVCHDSGGQIRLVVNNYQPLPTIAREYFEGCQQLSSIKSNYHLPVPKGQKRVQQLRTILQFGKCLFFYEMEMIRALDTGECFCGEVNGLHFGGHVTAFRRLNPHMISYFDARRIAALRVSDFHVFIPAFDKTDDHFSFGRVLEFFTKVRLKIL